MNAKLGYTFGTRMDFPIHEVRQLVEAALKAEGFGILTEIDVAATLRAKLGVETEPYLILGACNPGLAHRALEVDPSIGALLPCNVVLRRGASPGETVIEILEPRTFLAIADGPGLAEVAREASERLHRVSRVLESLAED
jgi:uncharacterized protein (DUF302 family)